MKDETKIRAKKKTVERIKQLAEYGDSYNTVIERALDALEQKEQYNLNKYCKAKPKDCALSIKKQIQKETVNTKAQEKEIIKNNIIDTWTFGWDTKTKESVLKHLKELEKWD